MGVAPPPPLPSIGDPATDAFVDLTTAAAPPPFALDVSSIRRDLDIAITIQAAYVKLLVDVLT